MRRCPINTNGRRPTMRSRLRIHIRNRSRLQKTDRRGNQCRIRRNHSRRMHSGQGLLARIQERCNAGVRRARVGGHERRDWAKSGKLRLEHHSASLGLRQKWPMPGVGEEGDRPPVGLAESCNAIDERPRISAQLAPEAYRELAERDRHVGCVAGAFTGPSRTSSPWARRPFRASSPPPVAGA